MSIKNIINWKIFFILLVASILSIIAILPYMLSLQWDILIQIPLPLPVVLLLSIIQNIVLFSIIIFFGLLLSKKVWLWTRYLEKYVKNKTISLDIKKMFKKSVLFWLWTGALIILIDLLFVNIGVVILEDTSIPIWQWALATFYGWISEEILLRLFLMSLVIWILNKVLKQKENNWIIYFAIIITAILFWVWHLPAVASMIDLTPVIIFRTILLNAIWGIVFWYLYWKQGLESSMVAHFSADIVLHVLLPEMVLFVNI